MHIKLYISKGIMNIAAPILGLEETARREVADFMKQSARQAEAVGLLEGISQIMAATGMPIPDTCRCDCGCRAAPTMPA